MNYVLLSAVISFLFVAVSFSADIYPSGSGGTQQAPISPNATTPANLNINGKVLSIDHQAGRIRVSDYLGTVTELKINNTSVITKGFKPAQLSDVNVGDTVLVSYDAGSAIQQLNVSETK
jgi:hypothetical protein